METKLKIFTVTTINSRAYLTGERGPVVRCVGYFFKFEDADSCVMHNDGDIHEDYYDYAIIEEVNEGLYCGFVGGGYFRQWYKWNLTKQCYEKCEEPTFAARIINWGIG